MDIECNTGISIAVMKLIAKMNCFLGALTSCDCCSLYAGAIFGAPLPSAALSRCPAVMLASLAVASQMQAFPHTTVA